MSIVTRRVLLLLIAGSFACGETDAGDPTVAQTGEEAQAEVDDPVARVSGSPEVEERYQESIDEAWQEALAGENPSTTCAGVKGRAVASPEGSATRALEACNIAIPVRYFLTYVDRVEAGDGTCMNLMTEVMTKLPAMTISTEGFRDLARRGAEANTSDAAAAGAGAAILAGEVAAGGGANDPRAAVKERLRDRVTEVCPEQAAIILR
jgi:hypothetical protein